jgi:hypothetical protein
MNICIKPRTDAVEANNRGSRVQSPNSINPLFDPVERPYLTRKSRQPNPNPTFHPQSKSNLIQPNQTFDFFLATEPPSDPSIHPFLPVPAQKN